MFTSVTEGVCVCERFCARGVCQCCSRAAGVSVCVCVVVFPPLASLPLQVHRCMFSFIPGQTCIDLARFSQVAYATDCLHKQQTDIFASTLLASQTGMGGGGGGAQRGGAQFLSRLHVAYIDATCVSACRHPLKLEGRLV